MQEDEKKVEEVVNEVKDSEDVIVENVSPDEVKTTEEPATEQVEEVKEEKDSEPEKEVEEKEESEKVEEEQKEEPKPDDEGKVDGAEEEPAKEEEEVKEEEEPKEDPQEELAKLREEVEEYKFRQEEQVKMQEFASFAKTQSEEFDKFCVGLGEALKREFDKFQIPVDKTFAELEKEDPAKANIAKQLATQAEQIKQHHMAQTKKAIQDAYTQLVFTKAERVMKSYDVSDEEAPIVAETFVNIMRNTGILDLNEDLKAKLELAVARAKMVCKKPEPTVPEVVETPKEEPSVATENEEKTEVVEEVKEENPPVVEEEVKEVKPDVAEFTEGVGGSPASSSDSIPVDKVLDYMAGLPYKERIEFYRTHYDLVSEAAQKYHEGK